MNDITRLSKHAIDPAERLIFALDVPNAEAARQLVETLGDAVRFYKIGLELFMAGALQSGFDASGQRHNVFLADVTAVQRCTRPVAGWGAGGDGSGPRPALD